MTTIEYPDEIFRETHYDEHGCSMWDMGDYVRRSYRVGLRDGATQARHNDHVEGFSNLTEAIAQGVQVDWERLNGVKATCLHPSLGVLHYQLVRDREFSETTPDGWCVTEYVNSMRAWNTIFRVSWYGEEGWSLWVQGDIPIVICAGRPGGGIL